MQKALDLYNKILTFFNNIALKISMAMLMAMLVIITIHVTMRYFVGNSIIWSEEVCRFMMVWISFLLLPVAQKRGQNIAVDFIVVKFRYSTKGIICAIGVELLAILVMAFALRYGWAYMLRAAVTSSEVLGLPMMFVYVVLPYSFGMTLLCCFERLIELFRCLPDPEILRNYDKIRAGDAAEEHV